MTVAVRGRLPSEPGKAFQEIQERLIALERNAAGPTPSFTSPSVPAFGGGLPPGGGTGSGGGGSVPGTGVSDHGALTGLADDDHPQYVEHGEAVKAHAHGPFDVSGLENRFPNRLERILPAHTHGPDDVLALEQRFPNRLERVLPPHTHGPQDIIGLDQGTAPTTVPQHSHTMGNIADLQGNDAQFVLSARIFGG